MRRSRSVMKRVIVFMIIGAIVNVAVAWGCALHPTRVGRHWYEQPSGFLEFTNESTRARTTLHVEPGRLTLSQNGPGVNVDYLVFPQAINRQQFEKIVPSWSAFSR